MSAMIWAEGMKRAGKNLNNETMVKSLESINNFDTRGICGPITYGPDDHRGLDYVRLYKADVEKEIFIPITDWIMTSSE